MIITECIAHCGGQIVNKGHCCCKFVTQRLTIKKREQNIKKSQFAVFTTYDISIGSTEAKYIKLSTKTQIFFNNIRLLYTL